MTETFDDIAHVMQFAGQLGSLPPVHDTVSAAIPATNSPGPQNVPTPGSEDSEHEVELECLDGASSDPGSSDSDHETNSVMSTSVTSMCGMKMANEDGSDPEEEEDEGTMSSFKGDPALAFKSVNEIQPVVNRPQVTKIDDTIEVQRVGEIQSIVGAAVVIQSSVGGQFRVLDTDSLLVFGDRTVLGLVFEAFGPIHAPMYVVRFNSASEIDTTSVRLKREVFHAPDRSTFLYTKQLRDIRGSDASNYWDEEVVEAQEDFSDDEQEALHRRRNKKNRQAQKESRGSFEKHQDPSLGQFNSSTEDPDVFYGDPYNDMTALPSLPSPPVSNHRPMPSPYDVDSPYDEQPTASTGSVSASLKGNRTDKRARRRGKGRGNNRSDRGPNRLPHNVSSSHATVEVSTMGNYDPRDPATGRPMSPMSLAIAKATGQWDSLPTATSMSQYSPRPFFNPNHPIIHQMGYGLGSWNGFGNLSADARGVSQSSFAPYMGPFAEGSTSQLINPQRQGYQFVGANSSNNTGGSQAQYNGRTNTDLEG